MNIELIGRRIAEERKRRGFTQEQLAEKLGVSSQAVSKWENGWNLPDIDNLNTLSDTLGVSIMELFGESAVDAEFVYRDRLFHEDKMFTRLRTITQIEGFYESYRALSYMREQHDGQFRKPGKHSHEQIPYINHPLMMACHAYYLGVHDDVILAAILLHDVVEDTDVTLKELPFSDDVKKVVELVSFCESGDMEEKEAQRSYYEKIRKDRRACVVKIVDRCNNVSTMAQSFSKEKLIKYVKETEEYIMPLFKEIKDSYPEYSDAAFVIKYHLISVIETVKNLVGGDKKWE